MVARVLQLNASDGGVPKLSLSQAEVAPGSGMLADRQNDLKHHGGPHQDLCLFRAETIRELQDEGHPIYPGAVGENITTWGLGLPNFQPGQRLKIGDVVEIELTEPAVPCNTIAGPFVGGRSSRISAKLHPNDARMYARVLVAGLIKPGDLIEAIIEA